jgi:hypothetical protein
MKNITEVCSKILEQREDILFKMIEHRREMGTNDLIYAAYDAQYEILFELFDWIVEREGIK